MRVADSSDGGHSISNHSKKSTQQFMQTKIFNRQLALNRRRVASVVVGAQEGGDISRISQIVRSMVRKNISQGLKSEDKLSVTASY